ncbi:tetratricopeptide repeat protein [Streptomyces sp. S.PB5]|uniref:tetratricopeptide repeat protein n=1 Tax=Streptomyces sp. S.PB5 TaxID=3020844 RepID=UPI0025B057DC|nr:tetratricopeptide repeat protein [Streptomyces sp. S.PB5]MDN3029719.1 tetratricopeptide repeat protein [Streptomyces sp. S.PB5]
MGDEERRRRTWGTRRLMRRFRGSERPDSLRGWDGDAAVAYLTRKLGPRHPDTLTARAALAYWFSHEGVMAQALSRLEALVVDRTAWFGPDDPDTVRARGAVFWARRKAGDLEAAIADAEALLADVTRLHGPHHEETHAWESRLAEVMDLNGDHAEAVRRLRSLYETSRSFGRAREGSTRSIRWNLIKALEHTGDAQEALALLALEIDAEQRTVYGVDENLHDLPMKRLQEWRTRLEAKRTST